MYTGKNFMKLRALIFSCSLLAVSPAVAEPPHMRVEKDGSRVILALYDAACDENPRECPIADLGCSSRGEFEASIQGLSAKEVGTWLATDEKVYLISGADRFSLRALRIENSDMTGDWDISLSQLNGNSELWRSIANSTTLSLSLGQRTLKFPRTGRALNDFRELLKGCVPH